MRACNLGALSAALFALWSNPDVAWAGNADAFYLSGDAALSAGAVTATTTGGGSIWYNPAGLADLTGTRLDVNVSGYAVRFGATANFESSAPNASQNRLALLDLDVVPAAVTLTRKIGEVGVGIGVFIPSQSAVTLRTQLKAPADENGNALQFGYDSTSRFQEYHMGPGFGWRPSETLSLGASLLANYRTRVEVTDVSASVEGPAGKTSWARHHTLDSQGVGLEMVLGAQLHLSSAWTLGAVVRTPAVRLAEAAHQVDTEIIANSTGTIEDDVSFTRRFGVSTQVLTPFRFHVGLAYAYGDSRVSADGSVLLPFKNKLFDVDERTTWNARAGIRTRVDERWSVGGGVFTDRSQFDSPTQFQQSQLNYYGATFAVDWLRSYGVYAKGDRVLEEPVSLVFGTTIALSYAVGVGAVAGARVGPADDGSILIEPNNVNVLAHEITVHLASALFE